MIRAMLEAIGNTPLVRLGKIVPAGAADVLVPPGVNSVIRTVMPGYRGSLIRATLQSLPLFFAIGPSLR